MPYIIDEEMITSLRSQGVVKNLYNRFNVHCFPQVYIMDVDWFYNFSTSTMFSHVDLDLAVNAYPVHLIR